MVTRGTMGLLRVGATATTCLIGLGAAAGEGAAVDGSDPASAGGSTSIASVNSSGAQAKRDSIQPAISAHGRFVAFVSGSNNLVPNDTNRTKDVFVRDRADQVTRRVSVSSNGAQAGGPSIQPAISANGRYVAFTSAARTLVPADKNHSYDVFVRDRVTHVTRLVSRSVQDGQADSDSSQPAISANGRYVAFKSSASNLVPGDTNTTIDVFVRDRKNHTTRRVSVSSNGAQADSYSYQPEISADGRYVAFISYASNLVPGDTNDSTDVFVRDRKNHTTRRVSVSSNGAQAEAGSNTTGVDISGSGRYVAFDSNASNLVPGDTNDSIDVFVRDRRADLTRRVSLSSNGDQGDSGSTDPTISADGHRVAFASGASNLVAGDTNATIDAFVRNRVTNVTRMASVSSSGDPANSRSFEPKISADGRHVAFFSFATNLVTPDTNGGQTDVFVRDLSR